ncbi:MAG: TetR/AcrR family transcriptional regulator [Actinomycetota bacterium]|nr:TetR/AcrR family transcriptional regulator [Actinomycetota bacterium]
MEDTRARIVDATAALFMQRGYAASGLKQISGASTAPIGSLYHFFPGGKAELAAATLTRSGQAYQELVETVIDAAPDLVTGVRDCFLGAAETLRASGYADACPIATVALEVASSDEALRGVTERVFASWLRSITHRLVSGGVPESRAPELATVFLAALEGGFLLSRVARDATAMETIGATVVELVRQAVAAGVDVPGG